MTTVYEDPEDELIAREIRTATPERRGRPSGAAYEARQLELQTIDERIMSRVDRARAEMTDPSDGNMRHLPCPRCGCRNAIGSADWVTCLHCGEEYTPPVASTPIPEKGDLEIAYKNWNPHDDRTVSCSNCSNCIIYGSELQPRAKCAKGYGKPTLAWNIIRLRGSQGFVDDASTCPDFDSMSEEN